MGWKEWVPTLGVVAVVAVAIVWTNRGGGAPDPDVVAPRPGGEAVARVLPGPEDRTPRCLGLTGTPDQRVVACLADLGRSTLSDGVSAVLADAAKQGKIATAARGAFPGEQVSVIEDADLRGSALGTDEQAFAKALRDRGVRAVVVSRDFTQALDRDRVVLARLAHHDFVEWFQLRWVTEDLLVYTVRSSPARIPIDTGDDLLRGLRQRLTSLSTGRREVSPQRWNPKAIRLIGSMRTNGATLSARHVVVTEGANVVERALDELADKLYREWERKLETKGHGALVERLDDVRLEVQVVMERAPIEPRTRYALFDLFEMGVDGMMFRQRPGEGVDEKFTFMAGSELVTRSMHGIDEFLRAAVEESGWADVRPWEKDTRTRLDLIRTQHFMESTPGGGPAVRLVRGAPEVPLEAITDRHVQDMLVAGGEWWLANQFRDGKFEYKWWPDQNRRSTEYNEVRHILAARDLADTWRYRHDPRYLDGSRLSMDWLFRYTVRGDDAPQGPLPHPPAGTLLFRYPSYAEQRSGGGVPNQKLGTVAVGLLGWIAWAKATGSHAEDANIRQMAEFVLSMQEPDGRFKPYLVNPGHSYEDERNDIVPGEAMLALGEVAEYFDEPRWVEPYGKFVEFYQPWFRERSARKVPSGRWPHDTYADLDRLDMVQFGPWSVMAAKQVHKLTKDPRAVEFGLEVADWMIDSYQWSADRSPWPDYVGGYYKMPEELPAMQTFCYSEGTAAAYTLALRAADPRVEKYRRSTHEAIRFAEVMQFDDLDAYWASRPIKVRGGVKYTMNEQKVRIDYVGHGLSTLSQWLDARAEDPEAGLALHDPEDLARLAGSWRSVPGLDYSSIPLVPPSGEVPGQGGGVDIELEVDGDGGRGPE
jgi:hypothetical protein